MKREKTSFEKGNALANFSLLYPQGPGISLNVENTFLELSPAAAHDLRLDDILAAFTSDRGQQREIQELFSRLPRDSQVISYRQALHGIAARYSISYPQLEAALSKRGVL